MDKKAVDMITSMIIIEIKKVHEAPKYHEGIKIVKAVTAIIVERGTESGNPTVDIQLEDADGNKYAIMALGSIFEGIGGAIAGVRERTNGVKVQ